MNYTDICIIGAGPAGLFAAIHAANPSKKITVLEKNTIAGKKLLISGLSQCNITNAKPITGFPVHYGGKDRFVRPALLNFTNTDLLTFFRDRGCEFDELENGKVFPASRKAKDIRDILIAECTKKNIDIVYGQPVNNISHTGNNFIISGDGFAYTAIVCVIAAGGRSYPATGSTGDGYSWAQYLGHEIIPPRPALTSLVIENSPIKDLTGISFENVTFSVWRNNKKIHSCTGDFLITHVGVSGIVVIDNSRYIQAGDILRIAFASGQTAEELNTMLIEQSSSAGIRHVKAVCSQLVPKRLLERILELSEIPQTTTLSNLTKKMRSQLINFLTAFPLEVHAVTGFQEAMVTAGGVACSEINPKTMESRIINNLYFAGEVIDIDGDSGGYNLQAAFSTGYLAGNSIKLRLNSSH
ncbi:MAG: NAD(P)/FAD-dependent oxidoreductase [Spirochaetales bacterium]|nr:NAD(P)/FAD-dependent oxidoreductase [Spirochaetales bacterium]